jgi:hypothetical protein
MNKYRESIAKIRITKDQNQMEELVKELHIPALFMASGSGFVYGYLMNCVNRFFSMISLLRQICAIQHIMLVVKPSNHGIDL